MWQYSRLATAPPAEWPVISREDEARLGFSSSSERRRAAMGATMFLATERKPEWHRLEGSSRKSCGALGSVRRLMVQSRRDWVPRMAKTMVLTSSRGTD